MADLIPDSLLFLLYKVADRLERITAARPPPFYAEAGTYLPPRYIVLGDPCSSRPAVCILHMIILYNCFIFLYIFVIYIYLWGPVSSSASSSFNPIT